tara:strand:- start:159 stop:398 length:240 start_codon:yes stop_codon:yes gene_type:complete
MIERFALAQYYMGIGRTLATKESIAGKTPLADCTLGQLRQIISDLRRQYESNLEFFQKRKRTLDEKDRGGEQNLNIPSK